MDRNLVRLSKFVSLVLRHQPEIAGLTLGQGGWVEIEDLVAGAKKAGVELSPEALRDIVEREERKRFTISDDGRRIKANYGHSLPVDLGLEPTQPPETLFHGTAWHLVEGIAAEGIARKGRHYVHLSADGTTALEVGRRHGQPVVLKIRARAMHEDGFEFRLSESGIWLTRSVPPHYIEFPSGSAEPAEPAEPSEPAEPADFAEPPDPESGESPRG
ncbi:MAG: RNA 2'-phosphotransferase, partial [bacterium]